MLLLGGMSAGALTGCGTGQKPPISEENVYTNNHYVPGVGYYHAPFHAWYQFPYNHFDPQRQRYYYGGQWGEAPCQSVINISSPTAAAAGQAEVQRTDVARGGFGGTSHGFFIHS